MAIDDFGTGYSSPSYLSRVPVDILKIDQSFVGPLGSAKASPAELTRTMVSLGRSLGMTTVAEGIERGEQLSALREIGCRQGQGFLLARPMPAGALPELLAHRQPAGSAGASATGEVATPDPSPVPPEPELVDSGPAEPTPAEPRPAEPTPAEPTSAEPILAGSAPGQSPIDRPAVLAPMAYRDPARPFQAA